MAKGPGGRPTSYTPELGDLICEGIANARSLASICNENEDLPTARSVYTWLRSNEEFLLNYERSKEDQADYLAEEILEIADDSRNDFMDRLDENGEVSAATKLNSENIQRSRLRVDARKWIASKFKTKRYGDKVHQEIDIKTMEAVTDEDLAARVAELLAKS